MKKSSAKKDVLVADREGGLELTPEFMRAAKVKLGDDYAVWRVRGGFKLVFLKHWQGKTRIPKHAHYGKIEPALPGGSEVRGKALKLTQVKKRKLNRKQALKDLMAIGPVDFKPRKPEPS